MFLDAFRGIFAPSPGSDIDLEALYPVMPMVHCHCFTRELDRDTAERDIRQVRVSSINVNRWRILMDMTGSVLRGNWDVC